MTIARPEPWVPEGPALAPELSLDGLIAWTSSHRVVSRTGVVQSWWSPRGTGFPYPEAAGLWLSLVCGELPPEDAPPAPMRDAVAEWLCAEIRRVGAAARGETAWLFDSGIALRGLGAYAAAGGAVDVRPAADRLARFIEGCVSARTPLLPNPTVIAHWSHAFGSHLAKVAMGSHAAAPLLARPVDPAVDEWLWAQAAQLLRGARFAEHAQTRRSYLHATIYGYEGAAHRVHLGDAGLRPLLSAGAAWVASIQRPDGGVPPFADDERAWGEPRSDVAAQAVRLWTLDDPQRWSANIRAALDFLGTLQTPAGGLRYAASSPDVNTWATLFAAQALRWALHGADPARLF